MEYKTKVFIGSIIGGIIICWLITITSIALVLLCMIISTLLKYI